MTELYNISWTGFVCVETETFFLSNPDTMITTLIVVDISMRNRFQGQCLCCHTSMSFQVAVSSRHSYCSIFVSNVWVLTDHILCGNTQLPLLFFVVSSWYTRRKSCDDFLSIDDQMSV